MRVINRLIQQVVRKNIYDAVRGNGGFLPMSGGGGGSTSEVFTDVMAETSPDFWYRLADASGTVAVAETGTNALIDNTNPSNFQQAGLISNDSNTCYHGGDDYKIIVPADRYDDPLTMAVSINMTAQNGLDRNVLMCTGGESDHLGQGCHLVVQSDGSIGLRWAELSPYAWVEYNTASGLISLGTTYHIIARKSDTRVTINLNGVDVLDQAITTSGFTHASLPPVIGATKCTGCPININGYSYFFNGKIDEPALWERWLTDTEVIRINYAKAGEVTPSSSYKDYMISLSPLVYWRLGEGITEKTAVDEMDTSTGTYNLSSNTFDTDGLLVDDIDSAAQWGYNKWLASDTLFTLGFPLSITAVFSLNSFLDTYSTIVHTGNSNSNPNQGINLEVVNTGAIRVSWIPSSPTVWQYPTSAPGLVTLGSTYSVVMAIDSAGLKVWLNGTLVIDEVHVGLSGPRVGLEPITVGAQKCTGCPGNINARISFFDGVIDEPAVFTYALDATAADTLYRASAFGNSTTFQSYVQNVLQPVAWWRLGESVGATVAVDETGNYDAAYDGVYEPSTGLLSNDLNTSVLLDGSTGYVSIPEKFDKIMREDAIFSFIFLFSFESGVSGGQTIFSTGPASTNNGSFLSISDLGSYKVLRFQMFRGVDSSPAYDVSSSVILQPNTTYFGAVTVNGVNGASVYINEASDSGSLLASLASAETSYDMTIGRFTYSSPASGSYFKGRLDEPALFDKVLTPSEVSSLYQLATQ